MKDKSSDQLQDISSITLANILERIIGGAFWYVLVILVSKPVYGEITYILSIAFFAFGFSKFGLNRLIIVYGAKGESVFYPAFVIGMISSISAGIITFVVTQNLFVSFLIWGMMIFELLISDVLSKSYYKQYSKYIILRRSLSVGLSLYLYTLYDINGIIIGFVLSYLIGLVIFKTIIQNAKPSISVLKNKLWFTANNYFTSIVQTIMQFGTPILIGIIFGFTLLAEYQLAYQYLLLLSIIPSIMNIYLLPKESQGIKNTKLKIFSIVITIALVIISIITIPFAVEIFIPKYSEVILLMQIFSLSVIPLLISIIYESTLLGNEKSKLVLFSGITQVSVFLPLLVLLGNNFGVEGFAIAFLISSIVRSIFNSISYNFLAKIPKNL